ncbi:hypothetical protein DQ04_02001080 [Trypanosoma grayi]|uniref:hypothetical protein n=1 Tax=Trypanosoma grayi TaxID=71804 RepID=UPI0004F472FC|nr:hypothetical protein DQ04_02001080 [Trypanosoma grayi]KEG12105.1 hypothetical protein DQ04_02001080 [Trypanosoma grayi]
MPRDQARKHTFTATMEDGLTTWQRLQQWGAAAELLYAPHSPVNQPPSLKEPHTFLVARRIATVMARLNELCQKEAEVVLTPRDALVELADIVRFALVSFHREVVVGQLGRADIAAVLAEYVANRTAPQAGVVEGLHVITWVSVKLRVEMFVEQLRKRLALELGGDVSNRHTPQQLAALRTTVTLLSDFEASYDNALVTFPCVQLMDTTPEAAEQLMSILLRHYYQLAEWVDQVESSTLQPPITGTWVQSVSRETATVVLRRTDVTSPWGMLFNECGRLVGIDVTLRSTSAEGEELHQLLRGTTQGTTVVAVNSTTVPGVMPDGASGVIELIASATKSNKRLVVKLAPDTLKQPKVHQLAFLVPNQGGEGSSGQRATLVLYRPDRRLPWGCEFTESLVVSNVPKRALLESAKNFFSEYKGRVGLLAVNGVEVTNASQAEALCADTETIVLNLVLVSPAINDHRRSAKTHTISTTLSPKLIGEARETPLVETGTARFPEQKKRKSPKKQQKKGEPLNAEEVDAAADAMYAADANEAEELTAEPEPLAEEDDVKETYPMVADEEATPEEVVVADAEQQEGVVAAAAETPNPLVLSDNVKIELLTPSEMVIHRNSASRKWGLTLESAGDGADRTLRITQLLELASRRDPRRRHPFYKTFEKPPVKTEWRIESVNGTPVSKSPELLDIMRRSLTMRIKFFRGR